MEMIFNQANLLKIKKMMHLFDIATFVNFPQKIYFMYDVTANSN